jgi:hypothetical protein
VWTNRIRLPVWAGICFFLIPSGPTQEHAQCVPFTRGIKRSDREAEQSLAFLVVFDKSRYWLPLPWQLPVRPSRHISRKQEIKEKCRCKETGPYVREMSGRKLDTALVGFVQRVQNDSP